MYRVDLNPAQFVIKPNVCKSSRCNGSEVPIAMTRSVSTPTIFGPMMSSGGFPSVSRVQICGVSKHDCGYCKDSNTGDNKAKDTSVSYGFIAKSMAVEDYQSLMLTGWRRSGTYFYKPIMHKTCCPQYTIRLRVSDFHASKSQKKVMKNVTKFLYDAQDDSTFTTEENLKISPVFTFTNASKASDLQSVPTTPSPSGSQKLTVDLEPSTFTAEKFELYKRYQIDVHHDKPDEVTEQGFRRFLVDSPLKDTANPANPQYGSFHQCYRLNGVLIAVGVVDLLPLGLSSVYMFYDNNYKHLSLGKYTALREIEYCRSHNLEYYFMGFYIHTCEKMRYKGEYKPSELLCPTSLQWYPLSPYCSEILDKFNFSPFEPILAAKRAAVEADVGEKKVKKGADREGDKVSKDQVAQDAVDSVAVKDTAAATNSAVIADLASTATAGAASDPVATITAAENTIVEEALVEDTESMLGEEEEEEGDGSDTELEPSLLDEFAPMYFNNSTLHSTSITNVTTNSSDTTNNVTGSATTRNSSNTMNTTIIATTTTTIDQAMRTIPLDIGVARPIVLSDLRPESVAHLQPFLQEWIGYVGPVSGAKITVSLV